MKKFDDYCLGLLATAAASPLPRATKTKDLSFGMMIIIKYYHDRCHKPTTHQTRHQTKQQPTPGLPSRECQLEFN
jgi:hypothetical protein